MTLYLYKIGTSVQTLTLRNVQGYTADSVTALDEHGEIVIFAPLIDGYELSSKPDCSETLRQAWRTAHPDAEARLGALEAAIERGLAL